MISNSFKSGNESSIIMKTKLLTTVLIFATYSFCCSFLNQEEKDEQHYGQKPPGKTPEIYSPKFSFIQE
jgi:hypothetical protein